MPNGVSPLDIFFNLLLSMGVLWLSITVHEAAHAWTALRLGDPTAKHQGRVSLNPLEHIDPIGTVLLPLVMLIFTSGNSVFGWAKPTPFNPWNLKDPKKDSALISLAGPASNLLIAVLFAIIFRLYPNLILFRIIELNVILAVFNLVPIHPLDGFKVLGGFLPKQAYLQWIEFEKFGPILLIFVIFFGGQFLSAIARPITYLLIGA